ncbi:MAG: hypothetical protein E6Q58_04055 [Niabella sp.]|nr:MAG: hypothetical protein E6Q58_04055 [Niabella sp.]
MSEVLNQSENTPKPSNPITRRRLIGLGGGLIAYYGLKKFLNAELAKPSVTTIAESVPIDPNNEYWNERRANEKVLQNEVGKYLDQYSATVEEYIMGWRTKGFRPNTVKGLLLRVPDVPKGMGGKYTLSINSHLQQLNYDNSLPEISNSALDEKVFFDDRTSPYSLSALSKLYESELRMYKLPINTKQNEGSAQSSGKIPGSIFFPIRFVDQNTTDIQPELDEFFRENNLYLNPNNVWTAPSLNKLEWSGRKLQTRIKLEFFGVDKYGEWGSIKIVDDHSLFDEIYDSNAYNPDSKKCYVDGMLKNEWRLSSSA